MLELSAITERGRPTPREVLTTRSPVGGLYAAVLLQVAAMIREVGAGWMRSATGGEEIEYGGDILLDDVVVVE